MPRGRPKLDNPKSRQLNLRMLPETRERLEKLSQWRQMTKADFIRTLIDMAWKNR